MGHSLCLRKANPFKCPNRQDLAIVMLGDLSGRTILCTTTEKSTNSQDSKIFYLFIDIQEVTLGCERAYHWCSYILAKPLFMEKMVTNAHALLTFAFYYGLE